MPELTPQTYLIVFPFLFLAALVDSAAGGGGLISLPAYLLAGLPVHFAYGTNKFTSGIAALFSTARYLKSGKVSLLPTLFACGGAALGSWLGALLALVLSASALQIALMVLLPCVAVFMILRARKELPQAQEKDWPHAKTAVFSVLIGLGCGAYDGLFGPGTGTFLILAFTGILGMEIVTAGGSARTVNFVSNIAALVTFIVSGKVLWALALPGALFSILGGQVGTYLAMRKGAKFIRPLMLCVVILITIKVAYDFFSAL